MHKPLIKICGITTQENASQIEELNFDLLGFIFAPDSPRYIEPKKTALIKTTKLKRVGVFTKSTIEEILNIMQIAKLDYAQLHGDQGLDYCEKIGYEKIIKVFWPQSFTNTKDFNQQLQLFSKAAFFLFDSGVKGGGAGHTFDWQTLNGLNITRPWLLAGGLEIENAINALNLNLKNMAGLDFNSKLEFKKGLKDKQKLYDLKITLTDFLKR